MAFERWDVVTALFPFTETPVRKPRHVLVLSAGTFNIQHGHVIGCMITTALRSRWPSDIPIVELVSTGLAHTSFVRWKLFTIPFELIGSQIGQLAESDRGPVAARMAYIFIA